MNASRAVVPYIYSEPFGRAVFLLVFVFCLLSPAAKLRAEDRILLDPRGYNIRTDEFSQFAKFQINLHKIAVECFRDNMGDMPPFDDLGVFGKRTSKVIQSTLSCERFVNVPKNSPAREGVVTTSLWWSVMGASRLPDLQDFVDALTLSFEATSFEDGPEWNFCQDNPRSDKSRTEQALKDGICFNESDPCSMLTWGPRGATAGQGSEIRWIFWKLWQTDPELMISAFGSEITNVLRFLRLKSPKETSCDGTTALEHFVCGVWITPKRRAIWEKAILALGRSSKVHKAYKYAYALYRFDGYKIDKYYELWNKIGLTPTEIDYAFFFDRATHIGSPPPWGDDMVSQFDTCVSRQTSAQTPNAAARRCLSTMHAHTSMPNDRLGRDVAYYIDGFPEGALSQKEIQSWSRHIPLRAGRHFALSGLRRPPAPFPHISTPVDQPPLGSLELAENEKVCPRHILDPVRRKPR